MGLNKNENRKLIFVLVLIMLFFCCLISIYTKSEASLTNSAHDLRNETTTVSCLNCHWMHSRGSHDLPADPVGYRHSLVSKDTRTLCFVCHSGRDPNTVFGETALIGDGYLDSIIVYKPTQNGNAFPGQDGVNKYDVREVYQIAEYAGTTGSYHLYFGSKYNNIYGTSLIKIYDKFTCFDCHNHGVMDSASVGGRLVKLLWSKGSYDSFAPFIGKPINEIESMRADTSKYYATEYFCLSCHARNTFPNKIKAFDSYYWPAQIDDTAKIFTPVAPAEIAYFSTKHVGLERYGYNTVYNETRNPYGSGKDISCLVCHNIHASAYPFLMRGNYDQNTMCQQCHSPDSTMSQDSTYLFTYTNEAGGDYNYITTGHSADKRYYTTFGHGRDYVNEKGVRGADLNCSDCHGVHGTGHFKMVKLIVADPRGVFNTAYVTTYVLDTAETQELDSGIVSGFCASACHNPKSPNRNLFYWKNASSTVVADMPSIYRGKNTFDLSAHKDAFNSTENKAVCAACHDSHGTPYSALTWENEEALCFQCHDSTMSEGAPNIKKYFDTAESGRSHHPVDSTKQDSTKQIECTNCHNPHMATKSIPIMNPYDWSSTGDGYVNFTTHKGRAGFCLTCHYDYYKNNVKIVNEAYIGAFPPGVKMDSSSVKLIGAEFNNAGHNKRSDTTANYTVLIDCLNCHNPHGSTNPNNILDKAYFDTVDGDTDTFDTLYYSFNTPFVAENTRISRKFCYSEDGSSGCHTPQLLDSMVTFPDNLAVDSSHHNARKVPYGPLGNSYYIDEHDPLYNTVGNTPVSGILGCSVCHYKPHNPTPDYWYDSSATGALQYCLDCHRSPAARPSNYETMAKYYGGAPSKYESPYTEFNSVSYISKHLASGGIDSTTTGYCKECHGEHTDHNMPGGNMVHNEDISVIWRNYETAVRRQPLYPERYDTYTIQVIDSYSTAVVTNYLTGSVLCLSCHNSVSPGTFGPTATAPNIEMLFSAADRFENRVEKLYNYYGHGKTEAGSIPVYCFDCHTKHSSTNPSLLRTDIRDVIDFDSARNRAIRVEDLDTAYKMSANVRTQGKQYVCFACHTNAGSDYDSSSIDTVNAAKPNPGTILWRGKAVYESAGHGLTRIPGMRDTTYGTTATGLSCSWCHEPHGRGVDSSNATANWGTAFNSTFNDDMLKIKGNEELCFKCHDRDLTDTERGVTIRNIKTLFVNSFSKHDIYAIYGTTSAIRITCVNCHNPHTANNAYPGINPNDRITMNTGDDAFCLACHSGTPPAVPPYPAVAYSSAGVKNMANYTASAHGVGLDGLAVKCKTCHRPHGTNKKKLQREVYDFNQDNTFGGHSYDTIYTIYNSYSTTDYKDEEVCFGCHRNHLAEGAWSTSNINGWPAEWDSTPDIRKLYLDTATGLPKAVTHHNVFTSKQIGTDGVWSTATMSDDSFMECDNCHNQHVSTKAKPITDPDSPSTFLNTTGVELIRFCLRCHDNAPPAGVSRVLQSGKFENIATLYGASPYNFLGHYSDKNAVPIDCIKCHNTHGVMGVDRGYTTADAAYYSSNIAFYHDNTQASRRFCYNSGPFYTGGCHVGQYLTTQVQFPDGLGTSSVTGARNVPYGPLHLAGDTAYLTASYYIDEHNPYYDTPGNTSASGISACSVCHLKPHRPSPDNWYNSTATGARQYCLDCHRPPAGGSDTANSRYYGGAPSEYERPYIEFTSTAYISKHLEGVNVNANGDTTTAYCKKCHGEHSEHNIPGGTYALRRNVLGTTYVTAVQWPYTVTTNYIYSTAYTAGPDNSSFCLSCHRGDSTALAWNTFGGRIPPDIKILYETSGHGRLTSASGSWPVYCFDCHTKHSSTNPSMLRTEIRDIIDFASATNRNIRVEDLDSAYKKSVNVRTQGIQYVCFACHTEPGSGYETSSNDTVNALLPNPGTALWLGKVDYETAGHGLTKIPKFSTTYGTTATGMSCTWCHEPHGRGVNTTAVNWRTAYDSSINDDMLKIEGSVYMCLKCHDTTLVDTWSTPNVYIENIKVLFDSSVSRHNVYSTTANGARITCLNCHNPHTGNKQLPGVNPDNRTDRNVGDDIFCIACHDGTPPTYAGGQHYPNVAFGTTSGTGYNKALYESSAHGVGISLIDTTDGVWCRTCHKPHGTNKKKLLREVYDFNQDNIMGGHSYDSIYTTTAYGTTDFKDEEVCFGCHRNHKGESDWSTAWAEIPDILRFYKIVDTTGTSAVYGAKTRSHHPIYLDEQRGYGSTTWVKKIECEDCHNQHVATKAKPITDPDSTSRFMSAYGTDCITFCLRCHDDQAPAGILGLPLGRFKNIALEYDPDGNGIYDSFTGHYRQSDGDPLECRVCHSMHGSNFAKQIREDVLDGVTVNDSDTSKLVRYMFALTLDSAHSGGNDTLAVSSNAEICLACHSGKTQFYDGKKGAWQNIPLGPPPGYGSGIETANINASAYHPYLMDSTSTGIYLDYADTGSIRKRVKSVYSTTFNIDTTKPFEPAGCGCHGAHNPYKEATSEFADCFNCHNSFAAGIPDIETQFRRVYSKHPSNYNVALYDSTSEVRYMECFKCHIQFSVSGDTTFYHRLGRVVFVDVNSGTTWATRRKGYDNSSKQQVTLFCLSCHDNPKADPDDSTNYYGSTANSPYRFTDTSGVMRFGGDPIQLRPLTAVGDTVQLKPAGRRANSTPYYYPYDTASAHFDTTFGTSAVISGFSCTDCHDPHGSINNYLLQDFEEQADRKDYDRDGSTTRTINYANSTTIESYKLNEEKFCYFCHDGAFNTTGWNNSKKMKNIQTKFLSAATSRHKVDDAEQALDSSMIECTNCHNPHTARRDRLVVNPKTGERAEVASNIEMNNFCLGCHDTGGPGTTAVIPTNWDSGIKFPKYPVNTNNAEWIGDTWNIYNKESMRNGNKHFYSTLNVSCVNCHDSHGSSNYRLLAEEIVNVFPPYQTTYISAIVLMNQTKPDGRVRVEAYSSFGYSINKFCFACHKKAEDLLPSNWDPDYPSSYVYPGETAYNLWDFGIVNTTSQYNYLTQYDKVNGTVVANAYGKDKDCDYCHNPHSSDSLRVHMVRDTVPQDLIRYATTTSASTYGNRIPRTDWYKTTASDSSLAAVGVDFCLSKGCHITDRYTDLGTNQFLPYDQFNLLRYNSTGALPYSGKSRGFVPDGIKYTSARASSHPIVTFNENRAAGNTLICLSCHTPHGSPGNTELAKGYFSPGYESTYPQDNAGLRRAYYRAIYWWPASLRKKYDTLGQYNPASADRVKVKDQNIPAAGNDMCFECHPPTDIIGTVGGTINVTRTRFIGHEAVVGGAKIGVTAGGVNNFQADSTDFHKFTCSFCHGPHATTDEKLLTMKCYYAFTSPPVYKNTDYYYVQENTYKPNSIPAGRYHRYSRYYNYYRDPSHEWYVFRPAAIKTTGTGPVSGFGCHPYGGTEWGGNFKGWRTIVDTTKYDLDKPSDSLDTLYIYANTTRVYDTVVVLPNIGLPVKSNDMDVVLSWKSVYDTGGTNSSWVYAYNIYRGDTSLTKQNKFYKAKSAKTWSEWGYTFLDKVYDSGYLSRPKANFSTLYTIDPSISHALSTRYFYLVVPADKYGNEGIVEDCLDTVGVMFTYDSTPPRPITTLILTQELQPGTNTIGMRISWQDPGDNRHTSKYTVYTKLVDSAHVDSTLLVDTTRWITVTDTSSTINFDTLTVSNFGDSYNTVRYDSALFSSMAIYMVGIKASDSANNTCSVMAFKYLRVIDPNPANVTDLIARPSIASNISTLENSYNIGLSWSVPWDNALPPKSIPVYKVYRRLGQPIDQVDIDNYNVGTILTDIECLTSLTRYNNQPVSAYNTGTLISYTDNVLPNKIYYYAVTPIDSYATDQAHLADTAFGYYTDRAGYLYREIMNPALNTRLLNPLNGTQANFTRVNTQITFTHEPDVYDTARFKQYNFYRRYETSKVWSLVNPSVTALLNTTGVDLLQTSYPAGNYYYAASVVYNSTAITVGDSTRWFTNLESPLNLTAMIYVQDLLPPAPVSISAEFLPKVENGYDSIKLTWSGGTDTANFKNYFVSQTRLDGDEISSSEPGLAGLWHMDTAWNDSKNGNNGVPSYFGAAFSSSPRKFGTGSGSFDGEGFVNVPNGAALQITGDMTVEFWLYPSNVGTARLNPVDKSFEGEFSFIIETDGSLTYSHGSGPSNYIVFTALPTDAIRNGQWIHIVLTRDNAAKILKGYKNGQLVNTSSVYAINPSVSSEQVKFGMGYTANGYNGYIDEVAIYNRALTAEEITSHYAGGRTLATYTDISASTLTVPALIPSYAWQTTYNIYGAYKYKYKVTANDSALNYSEAVTNLYTRPPTVTNFTAQGMSTKEGILLRWADMKVFSEGSNYGADGYKIYGKKTTGSTETISRIFVPGTINVDTAYGVYYLGAVTADTTGTPNYDQKNQALPPAVATASSSYDTLVPSRLNDSSILTAWDAGDSSSTTWIQVDLGSDKVIDRIVFDNYGDGLSTEPLDTVMGYTILAATKNKYDSGLWETVISKSGDTPRQKSVYDVARSTIRYIKATNFIHSTDYPLSIFEIEAYHPNDTSMTSFEHHKDNGFLPALAGRFYTYGVILEDKAGTKSRSTFLSPGSISVLDIYPPLPMSLMASLVPAQENGYNSVRLSWSGGTDSNFKEYTITRMIHDSTDLADTVVFSTTNMYQTSWTTVAPSPNWLWQTTIVPQKYGAFKHTYKIRATDSANLYSETTVTFATRPPSYYMNFASQQMTYLAGNRLTWRNMLTYSETTDYGVGGYKIYGKKANNQADTLSNIFVGTTSALASGVYKLGEVTADTTGLPSYSTVNLAASAAVTSSNNFSTAYVASKVNDSSIYTLWRAPNSESTQAWIQLAFSTDTVIENIVYNNYGSGILFDTAQGYLLLVSSAAQNSTGVWETVADKSSTTQRGTFVYQRAPRTAIKYIRATNFSRSGTIDTTASPASVFEIEAYYPRDTYTTTFTHLSTNGYLPAEAGKFYAYAVTLENKTGYKGASVFTPVSVSVLDVEPPKPVIDLVAYGVKDSPYIYLKWSKPYDNLGVKEYEIWRRNNPDILSTVNIQTYQNYNLGTTSALNFTNDPGSGAESYFYAVAAIDSAGNKSKFAGRDYSAGATRGYTRDSIPPEPISLVVYKFDTATKSRIQLTWSPSYDPAADKKDYDSLFNVDTAFYYDRVTKYWLYRNPDTANLFDSTEFFNRLSGVSGRDTFDSGTNGVANGWSAGTWGGLGAPMLLTSIGNDTARGSNVQKLTVYNYAGDSKEHIASNQQYIKTAAYIKSVGYKFDTSAIVNDSSAVRYIFGLWLKAEALSGQPYLGAINLDIATNLNTGNESTYISLGRRELLNPSRDWVYYMFNLQMPVTTYSSTENGVMVWAANNGNIWLDNAELIKLGTPVTGVGKEADGSGLFFDSSILLNNVYYYAVTALDISTDPKKNEGKYKNIGVVSTEVRAPIFDTTMFASEVDPDPGDLNDGNKTGTTSTIKFLSGMDLTDRADSELHMFDSDNIYRNGDMITLQYRALIPDSPPTPKLTLLPGGRIKGDYHNMDSVDYLGGDNNYGYGGDGVYVNTHQLNPTDPPSYIYFSDTPYNTTTHKYESLYRVNIFVKDENGNGPKHIFKDNFTDLDTTDNNPDTTFLAILDNTPPSPPE